MFFFFFGGGNWKDFFGTMAGVGWKLSISFKYLMQLNFRWGHPWWLDIQSEAIFRWWWNRFIIRTCSDAFLYCSIVSSRRDAGWGVNRRTTRSCFRNFSRSWHGRVDFSGLNRHRALKLEGGINTIYERKKLATL